MTDEYSLMSGGWCALPVAAASLAFTEIRHARLKPVAHVAQLLRHGGAQVVSSVLEAVFDVLGGGLDPGLHALHLRPEQLVQGADLRLGVVAHLSEVRVQPGLHVLHVVRGAGLKLLEVLGNMPKNQDQICVMCLCQEVTGAIK